VTKTRNRMEKDIKKLQIIKVVVMVT